MEYHGNNFQFVQKILAKPMNIKKDHKNQVMKESADIEKNIKK